MARPHPASGARVLFLDNSYTYGGAIICLRYLVDGLDDLGIDSVVVSGQPAHVMNQFFGKARSARVIGNAGWRRKKGGQPLSHRLGVDSKIMSKIVGQLSSLKSICFQTVPAAIQYAWIGFRNNVDLIHLNNTLESQMDGVLAARLLRVPCVAHARGFQQSGRLVRQMIASVARHIAISQAVMDNLIEMGVPEERISLIHDAVDIESFAESDERKPIRQELGVPAGAVTFGMVGRIVEWKGVREFVLAAIRVLRKNLNAYALIVGDESDGELSYFREVKHLAESSAVGERIVFTGYRDDIPSVMKTLDVVVHTSVRPEPFGLVLAEAMAAGRPVVAARRGGPEDIVVEGETGFLVDPTDTPALAHAIEQILQNPSLARRLGEGGMHRAREKFGTERYAREVADVYEEVGKMSGAS